MKEFNSYDDRNFYFTTKEKGGNVWPHGYILKVGVANRVDNRHSIGSVSISINVDRKRREKSNQ